MQVTYDNGQIDYTDVEQGPTWQFSPDKKNHQMRISIDTRHNTGMKDFKEAYWMNISRDQLKSLLKKLG